MKFNKIITVLLLCGLCATTSQRTVTANAATADTVISNQVTQENDTEECNVSGSAKTIGFDDDEDEMEVNVISSAAVVAEADVVTASGIDVVSSVAVSVVSNSEKAKKLTESEQVEEKKSSTTTTKKATITVKSKVTKKTTKKKATKKYTNAELRLMSSLIYCEANGEPYAGKLAVGIVVMNRKSSKSFPNTLKGVIYQKYQFGPARNGSLKRALKEYDAGRFTSSSEKACIKAAKAALNGEKKVTYKSKTYNMKSFYFFSTYVKGKRLTIKNHQFK